MFKFPKFIIFKIVLTSIFICSYVYFSIGLTHSIFLLFGDGNPCRISELNEDETSPLRQFTVEEIVKKITNCSDKNLVMKTKQRGNFMALYNYIKAERNFTCSETISYTTHGDYLFLDNLVPLLERWQGPVSMALYAPGTDFINTLLSISYLRECSGNLVKDFVTFHIYFDNDHVPEELYKYDRTLLQSCNCSDSPPFITDNRTIMYKTQKGLLYPINVGRNIARETAQTHFILASDIELYPSLNLIPKFLTMIAEKNGLLLRCRNPIVFPLHLFEVESNQQVPNNKTTLQEMLAEGTARKFHEEICPSCHNVPKTAEWIETNETDNLSIFTVSKRLGMFNRWEPIFIGTNSEPWYDERLSWEGKLDKMTQGYSLCALNYDFMVLDNAFLVHRPGIKVFEEDIERDTLQRQNKEIIDNEIYPELRRKYGPIWGCSIY